MTEDDAELLYQTKEQYWLDFSNLVNETLSKVPEHLQDDLEMMLQDSSSVYSRSRYIEEL